jgi:hypothetical protein
VLAAEIKAPPAPVRVHGMAAANSHEPVPPPPPTSVAVFGDSVPDWLVRDAGAAYDRADFTVIDAAHEACDGAVNTPPARSRRHRLVPPADCRPWTESYPAVVADPAHPVDVALLVLGQAPTVDYEIGGRWVGPCTDMNWYSADVMQRIAYLRDHVAHVVLALPAWGSPRIRWFLADDYDTRYTCIREALKLVAAAEEVPTIDLAAVLCPAGPDGDCPPYREDDGLHVDTDDAPAVLGWMLDQVAPLVGRKPLGVAPG